MTDQAESTVTAPASGDGGQQSASEAPKEVTVPLPVLQTVEGKLKDATGQVSQLQAQLQNLQLMQRFQGAQQQTQPQQPVQPAPQPQEDLFSGVPEDDLPTVRDVKAALQRIQSQTGSQEAIRQVIAPLVQQLQQQAQTVNQLQLRTQDPNYEQTIRTYLPEMLTQNPSLQEMIGRSQNPVQAALAVAKMSPKYQQTQQHPEQTVQTEDPLQNLQKIIENATKPNNPASMGGGGFAQGNDRFRGMSDADFDAEVNRVMNGQLR